MPKLPAPCPVPAHKDKALGNVSHTGLPCEGARSVQCVLCMLKDFEERGECSRCKLKKGDDYYPCLRGPAVVACFPKEGADLGPFAPYKDAMARFREECKGNKDMTAVEWAKLREEKPKEDVAPPRKRGRPPKKKEENAIPETKKEEPKKEEPKKRGRPPKHEEEEDEERTEIIPKKRGRPPKHEEEEEEEERTEVIPKKRGRPAKHKEEEPEVRTPKDDEPAPMVKKSKDVEPHGMTGELFPSEAGAPTEPPRARVVFQSAEAQSYQRELELPTSLRWEDIGADALARFRAQTRAGILKTRNMVAARFYIQKTWQFRGLLDQLAKDAEVNKRDKAVLTEDGEAKLKRATELWEYYEALCQKDEPDPSAEAPPPYALAATLFALTGPRTGPKAIKPFRGDAAQSYQIGLELPETLCWEHISPDAREWYCARLQALDFKNRSKMAARFYLEKVWQFSGMLKQLAENTAIPAKEKTQVHDLAKAYLAEATEEWTHYTAQWQTP